MALRAALGATRSGLVGLVLRSALIVVSMGICLGLAVVASVRGSPRRSAGGRLDV